MKKVIVLLFSPDLKKVAVKVNLGRFYSDIVTPPIFETNVDDEHLDDFANDIIQRCFCDSTITVPDLKRNGSRKVNYDKDEYYIYTGLSPYTLGPYNNGYLLSKYGLIGVLINDIRKHNKVLCKSNNADFYDEIWHLCEHPDMFINEIRNSGII